MNTEQGVTWSQRLTFLPEAEQIGIRSGKSKKWKTSYGVIEASIIILEEE